MFILVDDVERVVVCERAARLGQHGGEHEIELNLLDFGAAARHQEDALVRFEQGLELKALAFVLLSAIRSTCGGEKDGEKYV